MNFTLATATVDAADILKWVLTYLLPVVFTAGGLVFLLRSQATRIERLEKRVDEHSARLHQHVSSDGHKISLERIEALDSRIGESREAFAKLDARLQTLNDTMLSFIAEIKAERRLREQQARKEG